MIDDKTLVNIPVNKLKIIHKGNFVDGYPTIIKIDGVYPKDTDPTLLEKSITVEAKVDEKLTVTVKYMKKTIIYWPREFDLVLGDIQVSIKKDRNPCGIYVKGYEVYAKSVKISFVEGECVLVDLCLMPHSI